MDEFAEDFSLFIETGFVAVKQLDETSARQIFEAAELLSPEHPASSVGLGYIALNKLEIAEAVAGFEEALEREPEHHLAQTFLGISYLLSADRRKEGEQLIEDAMEKTDDPTIENLGKISLEWAEKDLTKKKPGFFTKLT